MSECVTDAPLSRTDRVTESRSLERTSTLVDSTEVLVDVARELAWSQPSMPVSYQILVLWTAAVRALSANRRDLAGAFTNDILAAVQRLRQTLLDAWEHAPSPLAWQREVAAHEIILAEIGSLARRLLLESKPDVLDRRMHGVLENLDRSVAPWFPAGRLSSRWYLGSVVRPPVLLNFYFTLKVDLPSATAAGMRIDALLDEQCVGGAAKLTHGERQMRIAAGRKVEVSESTAGPGYRIETKIAAPPVPWDLEAWDEAGSVAVSIRSADGGGVKLKTTMSAPSVALILPDGISELEVELLPLPNLYAATATQSTRAQATQSAAWAAIALAIAGVVVVAPLEFPAVPVIALRLAAAAAAAP